MAAGVFAPTEAEEAEAVDIDGVPAGRGANTGAVAPPGEVGGLTAAAAVAEAGIANGSPLTGERFTDVTGALGTSPEPVGDGATPVGIGTAIGRPEVEETWTAGAAVAG